MLQHFKQYWNKLVAAGTVIFTALKGFLVPPTLGINEVGWYRFGAFLTALITGIWLVPMSKWTKRSDSVRWAVVAVALIALSLCTFVRYSSLLERWTIVYWRDQRVVIGQTMTEDGRRFKAQQSAAGRSYDDLTILESYGGNASAIWDSQEIEFRKQRLAYWYLGSILTSASAILATTQAAYCAGRRT